MDQQIKRAAREIRRSRELLVFTGAGVSASGIPTFRDDGGFWRTYPPEHFATWKGLFSTAMKRPKQLADFLYADIVLFGDEMAEPAWTEATQASRRCDCVLAVGSSSQVFPAAALPMEARARGACIITVDPDNEQGDIVLKGLASEVVPLLFREAFDHPG